jgi:hypothetical protein
MGFWDWVLVGIFVAPSPSQTAAFVGGYHAGGGASGAPSQGVAGGGGAAGDRPPQRVK